MYGTFNTLSHKRPRPFIKSIELKLNLRSKLYQPIILKYWSVLNLNSQVNNRSFSRHNQGELSDGFQTTSCLDDSHQSCISLTYVFYLYTKLQNSVAFKVIYHLFICINIYIYVLNSYILHTNITIYVYICIRLLL